MQLRFDPELNARLESPLLKFSADDILKNNAESFERKTRNGLFIDSLIRKSTKEMKLHEYEDHEFLDELICHGEECAERFGLPKETVSVVMREELLGALSQDINDHWRAQGCPDPRKGLLQRHAQFVAQSSRQALILKTELENWNLKRQNLQQSDHAKDKRESETLDERTQRLKGFWSHYHTGLDKDEPSSPTASPKKDRQKLDTDPANVSRILDTVAEQKSSTALNQKSTMLPPLRQRDPWKHRGAADLRMTARENKALSKFTVAHEHVRVGKGATTSSSAFLKSTSTKWRAGTKTLTRQVVSLPELSSTHRLNRTSTNFMASSQSRAQDDNFHNARLPPIAHQFISPHVSDDSRSRKGASPTGEYFKACENTCTIPKLMPFVTGHSTKLHASCQALTDNDLMSFVAMLPTVNRIDEIDLSDNILLTDKSVIPLLNSLFGPVSSALKVLSLRKCLRNTPRLDVQKALDVLVQLVGEGSGLKRLRCIDLCGVSMSMKCHASLCKAIRSHSHLRTVNLADTGLTGRFADHCVHDLTQCLTLQNLDLGWNCFNSDIFEHLGDCVIKSKSLRTLCVANCSAAFKPGGDNPIQFFLEHFAHDKSLKSLDISVNRIDFRGALVLENAFNDNKTLEELNICQNPLGTLGMRSVLRLLARESCKLRHIRCTDSSSSMENSAASGIQKLDATNPCGRYVLNLHRPYHRALLQMLYRISERFSLSPEVALTQLEFSKGKYQHPKKDDRGGWLVPTDGRLSVTCNFDQAAMEASSSDVEPYDFGMFLERHNATMKLRPGFNKIVPLLSHFEGANGSTQDQLVILDALSHDFLFSFPEIKQLCQNRAMVNDILWRLMPCLVGGESAKFLISFLLPDVADHLLLLRRHRNFFAFNPQNPTGHYKLDLASPGDFAVAEDTLLIDRWEANTARKAGSMDTSQRGNGSRVRNARYQDVPLLQVKSVADWTLPETGVFTFDYSSSKRPPSNVPVLSDETFTNMLLTLESTQVSPEDVVPTLGMISHRMWLKALQLRELLGVYRKETVRVNVFVMFFLQIIDMHNEKVFRVRFENKKTLDELRIRLGQAIFFPYVQPEQTCFVFDYSEYDQRLAANLLFQLAAREGRYNIHDYCYIRADGVQDPLPLGIPRAWDSFKAIPTEGTFTATYNCAPEDRNYKFRRQLFETYALWKAPASENDVMWWAMLNETPEDVLEYLEFLVARFSNVSQAFVAIDGVGGNGLISLREFEVGMTKMNCKKFKGPHESERIAAIFRYLDPSGEGQVSKSEWSILDKLFKEIQLSIKEFVQFLERCFEYAIEDAWKFFDRDGGGEIDFEEWTAVLVDIGYFGPSRPIFSYLDKDDEGTISFEEFQALAEFQSESSKEKSKRRSKRSTYRGSVMISRAAGKQ